MSILSFQEAVVRHKDAIECAERQALYDQGAVEELTKLYYELDTMSRFELIRQAMNIRDAYRARNTKNACEHI